MFKLFYFIQISVVAVSVVVVAVVAVVVKTSKIEFD